MTGILFLLPLPTTQHCSNAPTTHSRGYGTITTYNPHEPRWENLFLSYLSHLRRLHAVYRTHMVILGLSLLEEATLPARNFSPLEVILSVSSAPRNLKAFFLSQEVLAGNIDTISISGSITKERWRLAEKHPTPVSEVFLQGTKKRNRLYYYALTLNL